MIGDTKELFVKLMPVRRIAEEHSRTAVNNARRHGEIDATRTTLHQLTGLIEHHADSLDLATHGFAIPMMKFLTSVLDDICHVEEEILKDDSSVLTAPGTQ
ncbi:uncharacterized protein [Ptychodera flava]|uniref:uncharacterized protein n=1 Tax=Ptychodera flava TaxID=63121 RepID=UPI00396A0429